MGDPFKKVQAGQPLAIPAETFNAFVDAAQDFRARQQARRQEHLPQFRQSGIVRVKNGSGADQERFAVLGIDRPIFTPADNLDSFQNEVALVGVVPDETQHAGRFAVLLEPLSAGAIGRACVSGVCPARVIVQDEQHGWADVRSGLTAALQSGRSGGARILWKDLPGGGAAAPRWAVVRIDAGGGGGALVLFQIESVSAGCCYADCTVLAGPCGSDQESVRVYDLAGCEFNVPPEDLIGKRCWAAKVSPHDPESLLGDCFDPYEDYSCLWTVVKVCCAETEEE